MENILLSLSDFMKNHAEILFAAFFLLFALFAAAVFAAGRKRRRELEELALRLGMRFVPKETDIPLDFLKNKRLPLFNEGGAPAAKNIFAGNEGRTALYVFDYCYSTGSGDSSTLHCQTPAVFVCVPGKLPVFTVEPEGLFNKLSAKLGYGDVNFEEYPVFSKMYWLKSPQDAQELRRVFHGDFVHLLEVEKGWHIQSDGQYVVFFKTDGYVNAAGYDDYVRRCRALFTALCAGLA